MKLVVVESPTKAKTIKQYLGKDYEVVASFGHIRQLPSKIGSVLPNEDFKMIYEYIEKSKKHINEIVSMGKKADEILIASDPDREGEAIAEAIKDLLLSKKAILASKIKRVTYNEVTKKAIIEAIANPREINNNLVEAQKARLALDYLVGFSLSPVLWRKVPGSKSAGRVQSVALRMIVDRELEIKKFKPQEYWTIDVKTEDKNEEIKIKIVAFNKDKFSQEFPNEKEAIEIEKIIKEVKDFKVESVEIKDIKQNPYPPFITSTLQQDASRRLGFSTKKTMQIAQKLYEGIDIDGSSVGLITYMRTDGYYISKDAVVNIRNLIDNSFGKNYLPVKPLEYKKKVKSSQEAHEAIRPTDINLTPEKLKNKLDKDMFHLYDMIWRRTIASQMSQAIKTRNTIDLILKKDKNEIFGRISETSLKFDGYLKIYNDIDLEDDIKFLDLKEEDILITKEILTEKHFTSPPARFNEASLIKRLEELGIGRPSTYASIISVLQDRNYVSLEKKVFTPEPLGFSTSLFLRDFFTKYVEYDFTAKLEKDLDLIASGDVLRLNFLKTFWVDFDEEIQKATKLKIEDVIKIFNTELEFLLEAVSKDKTCLACKEGKLKIGIGKFGLFINCNRYPDCKNIINIDKNITSESSNENKDNASIVNSKMETFEFEDGTVTLKTGKFGLYLEKIYKDTTKKNFGIPKKGFNKTREEFEFFSSLPKAIGKYDEKEVKIGIGKFGPYLYFNAKYYSVKNPNLLSLDIKEAIEIIKKSKK